MMAATELLFNPQDPEYQADPYPTFHRMRRHEPVCWSEPFQAWFLTGYRDVAAAARDPRLASGKRTSSHCQARFRQAGLDRTALEAFLAMMDLKMDELDGAHHDATREMAKPAFRSAALAALTPRVNAVVDTLMQEARGKSRFDFVESFAQRLPWTVICDIIGVPDRAGDRALLKRAKQAVSVFFTCPVSHVREAADGAINAERAYAAYFREMLREQRHSPGENLAGHFLRAERQGLIDEEQIIAQLVLFLGAGSSTVADALSNSVHALLTHPETLATLREHPERMAGAVDEFLRYNTPLPFMTRVASEDLTIGDSLIRKGQVVFLGFGAANRDPEVFPDPDRLDIERRGGSHLTFGHGPHFCIGSALARIEITTLLTALLREYPNLRLDPSAAPRVRGENLMCRGFHTLPLLS